MTLLSVSENNPLLTNNKHILLSINKVVLINTSIFVVYNFLFRHN